jgi:hypothetical protein
MKEATGAWLPSRGSGCFQSQDPLPTLRPGTGDRHHLVMGEARPVLDVRLPRNDRGRECD